MSQVPAGTEVKGDSADNERFKTKPICGAEADLQAFDLLAKN